jgi:hypothetical protein
MLQLEMFAKHRPHGLTARQSLTLATNILETIRTRCYVLLLVDSRYNSPSASYDAGY